MLRSVEATLCEGYDEEGAPVLRRVLVSTRHLGELVELVVTNPVNDASIPILSLAHDRARQLGKGVCAEANQAQWSMPLAAQWDRFKDQLIEATTRGIRPPADPVVQRRRAVANIAHLIGDLVAGGSVIGFSFGWLGEPRSPARVSLSVTWRGEAMPRQVAVAWDAETLWIDDEAVERAIGMTSRDTCASHAESEAPQSPHEAAMPPRVCR